MRKIKWVFFRYVFFFYSTCFQMVPGRSWRPVDRTVRTPVQKFKVSEIDFVQFSNEQVGL